MGELVTAFNWGTSRRAQMLYPPPAARISPTERIPHVTRLACLLSALLLSGCSVNCLEDYAILGQYQDNPDPSKVMVSGTDRAGRQMCYWSGSAGTPTNSRAWADCQANGGNCTVVASGSIVAPLPPSNLALGYAMIGVGAGMEAMARADRSPARAAPSASAPPAPSLRPVSKAPPIEATYHNPNP